MGKKELFDGQGMDIAALEGNLNVCFLIIASFPIGIASYFQLLRLF
jgi:hypothetical protein